MKTARQLASEIAEDLFTNGQQQKAQRLVMELPGKKDGGGWCLKAVIDRIESVLKENLFWNIE